MYRVRKVRTKSGSRAIQVVQYSGHRAKIAKHIGSAKDDIEFELLLKKAHVWIEEQTFQANLFPEQKQKVLIVERGECIAVTHSFAYQFFMSCLNECNLAHLPPLLLDLAIIRLIEPASKLRSIELLSRYFGINYSQRIYRTIPKLIVHKADIEQRAYSIAAEKFKEQFYYVLYDVTTLYFESFKADELKVQGFSKDNKSQQPQIVIGLLVTQSGLPLSYNVFAGNTFEGKTMLPVVEGFISKHPHTKPIVVADAAMLDEERLAELREKHISYIVGARLANANLSLVKQIQGTLKGVNGAVARVQSKHGELICDFSTNRYNKELNDLNRLIQKAEELVAKQSTGTKVKFIKRVSKEKIELNIALIEKRKLLLGIKGYCTDLSEDQLSSQQVIDRYHHLWRVEQSFRMSKFDLQARPIYHQKEDAIRSHVLICFVALLIDKYLELTTNISLRNIRLLVWNITESHIRDTITKETFKFISPTSEIMNSPLNSLIKKWDLIPH
jgi:Transposase DDE domain